LSLPFIDLTLRRVRRAAYFVRRGDRADGPRAVGFGAETAAAWVRTTLGGASTRSAIPVRSAASPVAVL
jgi:hypothetical protein